MLLAGRCARPCARHARNHYVKKTPSRRQQGWVASRPSNRKRGVASAGPSGPCESDARRPTRRSVITATPPVSRRCERRESVRGSTFVLAAATRAPSFEARKLHRRSMRCRSLRLRRTGIRPKCSARKSAGGADAVGRPSASPLSLPPSQRSVRRAMIFVPMWPRPCTSAPVFGPGFVTRWLHAITRIAFPPLCASFPGQHATCVPVMRAREHVLWS